MEDLIKLVAASFVRHGIECPASDSKTDSRTVPGNPAAPAAAIETANSQVAPTALPEHSYRKKPDASLAT
jgi:hypothetical protein